MTKLKISPNLSLPLDFVTSTQVILAQKGKGKTHTAVVEEEELLEAGQQIIVIDPTDAHWGLRSSPDGRSTGYPIAVFGGDHGDVPLDPDGGKLLAEAIVAERFSAIISTENLSKAKELTFVADFLETLYRKNRQAVHLFIDEADIFAPQKPFGGEARTCGAADDIVRRGRKKGIGCTLITQRSSVLNKNVLSQADMLVALGCSHPRDIDAVSEWVKVHADPARAREMIASLPSLPRGDAWVWNPAAEIFKRVTVRERYTFDSGRTPKPGEARRTARVLAPVDIQRLGASIAAQVERRKADDPKALKARVAELERQLAAKAPKVVEKVRVEKPIISDAQVKRVEGFVDSASKFLAKYGEAAATARSAIDELTAAIRSSSATAAKPAPITRPVLSARDVMPKVVLRRVGGYDPNNPKPDPTLEPKRLGEGERKVLTAIVQHGGVTPEKLTVLLGYRKTSRNTYLQRLGAAGLVVRDRDNLCIATPAGIAEAGDVEPLPTGAALRDWWLKELPNGEACVLAYLIDAYPKGATGEQIDLDLGYRKTSRNTYLQRLGARNLVERSGGECRASEELFA